MDCAGNPSTNIWNICQFSITIHLILQLKLVANKKIFIEEKNRKTTSVANSILSKFLKFVLRFLECSSAHWVKCTYTKLRGFIALLKKFLGVLKCR